MKLNWVERYKNGDSKAVWKEISNGQYLIKYEAYRNEIEAVLDLTIERIQYNIELIYDRLVLIGYPFLEEFPLEYKSPKGIISTSQLNKELNKIDLSIPILLNKFYCKIGGVDFRRDTTKEIKDKRYQKEVFENYYTDPLQVWGTQETCNEKYIKWTIEGLHFLELDGIRIDLCPDFYHKDNVSGGGGYSILIESERPVNPILYTCELDLKDFTLIDYFRLNFENGGFMGLGIYENLNDVAKEFRSGMIKGLKKI